MTAAFGSSHERQTARHRHPKTMVLEMATDINFVTSHQLSLVVLCWWPDLALSHRNWICPNSSPPLFELSSSYLSVHHLDVSSHAALKDRIGQRSSYTLLLSIYRSS